MTCQLPAVDRSGKIENRLPSGGTNLHTGQRSSRAMVDAGINSPRRELPPDAPAIVASSRFIGPLLDSAPARASAALTARCGIVGALGYGGGRKQNHVPEKPIFCVLAKRETKTQGSSHACKLTLNEVVKMTRTRTHQATSLPHSRVT
jgi:hypothetical protein